ncbi:thiamine pyrophosphate-dependent enzyme [Streptomyces griseoincarnatus]
MPYRPFYPSADVPVVQVAIRGEHIGRRTGVWVPLVETVTDTAGALLQLLREKPAVARAAGIAGVRADRAGELDDALREAFFHDGPAVVEPAPRARNCPRRRISPTTR